MWYKKIKRADRINDSQYIAEQLDIDYLFSGVGDIIHEDDLKDVQDMLEVTDACMELLFEPIDS